MSGTDLLRELEDNHASSDLVKARWVIQSLPHKPATLQQAAFDAISHYSPPFAIPLLGDLLDLPLNGLALSRATVAKSLAETLMEAPAGISDLSHDAQIHAITALGEQGDERALVAIRRLLTTGSPTANLRFTAYEALSKLPMRSGGYMLAAGLEDEDEVVRIAAARAIDRNINESLIQGLGNVLLDPEPMPTRVVEALCRGGALITIEALLSNSAFQAKLATYVYSHAAETQLLAPLLPLLERAGYDTLASRVQSAVARDVQTDNLVIYVVDDSRVVLQLFSSSLQSLGCRCRCFSNPFEAIEWIQREPPDLLFTDLNMPELDGIELTATLRNNPSIPDFPIVLVTTQAMGSDIQRALTLGVDDYVEKPFDKQDLSDAIGRLTDVWL